MADQPKDPNTLHIFIDDDGIAHTAKTPEESEQEIKSFIENAGNEQPEQKAKEAIKWVTVEENGCRHVFQKDYHGEAFIVEKNATLVLHDEVDPRVNLHQDELEYDGYAGEFSEQQVKNMQNLCDGELTLTACYINGLLNLTMHNTTIDDGGYDDILYGQYGREISTIGGVRPWLYLRNGACVDQLTVGYNTILYTNSDDDADEAAEKVHIHNLQLYGHADLYKCEVRRMYVDRIAEADLNDDCKVTELIVAGTAHIYPDCEIKTIRLMPGGRIYGDITNRNVVTSSRPVQIVQTEHSLWMFG